MKSAHPRILVVEDEAAIRVGICDMLAFQGYDPVGVADGQAGLEAALSGEYALLLLDVMLPHVDGFQICEAARQRHPRQAILMLTAKGSEQDVLEGFRRGADDYVSKPFSVAQLAARIRALLRRSGDRTARRFALGPVEVDADRQTARTDRGAVEISPRDVAVLEWFADRAGRVVGRPELLREVWGYARVDGVETRCVDMHIAKLRKKLSTITDAQIIETVRGAGYRFPVDA
ncbi:MAG: response regulator transcription factor [Myxococcota bacterium]